MIGIFELDTKSVQFRILTSRGQEFSNGVMRELNNALLLIENDEIFAPGRDQMIIIRKPLWY
jgi:hypothetical protein